MKEDISIPKFLPRIQNIDRSKVTLVEITDSGYIIKYKSENNDSVELALEDNFIYDFPKDIYFYIRAIYKDGSTNEFKQIVSTPPVENEQSFVVEDPRNHEMIYIDIIMDYKDMELSEVFQPIQDNTIAINDIYKALTAYSSDSIFILKHCVESENTTYEKLIKKWCLPSENYKTDIFFHIDTVVHEETHEFCFDYNMFLVNNEIIKLSVNNASQWPKTEIATKEIPETMRSSRWKTYVSSNATTPANKEGIIGLLNEFQAYYYGLKAVYDCFPYLKEINGYENDNIAHDYITSLYGNIPQSYYEFKWWILLYIDYLKQNMPDLYQEILNNKDLLKVFVFFNNSFELLVEKLIPEKINTFIDELNSNGITRFSIQEDDDGVLYLDSRNVGNVELGNKIVNSIRNELNKERYKEIISTLKDAVL